jgi:hypothetical protein
MRLVLQALISVLSFVGTTQAFEAVSVPVQYKGHEIQLPGRFDKPADPGPSLQSYFFMGAPAIRSTHRIRPWSSMLLAEGYVS